MSYEACVKAIPAMSYDEQLNLMSALLEAIKAHIHREQTPVAEKKDFRDSYPKGYFDLFGSIDDPTFVEPEDIPMELDHLEDLF